MGKTCRRALAGPGDAERYSVRKRPRRAFHRQSHSAAHPAF